MKTKKKTKNTFKKALMKSLDKEFQAPGLAKSMIDSGRLTIMLMGKDDFKKKNK